MNRTRQSSLGGGPNGAASPMLQLNMTSQAASVNSTMLSNHMIIQQNNGTTSPDYQIHMPLGQSKHLREMS